MAEVERHWFQRVIVGEQVPHVWTTEWNFQAAFNAERSTRAEAFGAWQAEVDRARSIESTIDSLDSTFFVEGWGCDASLRTVMLHVIHDYARHNGHADLLREGVDGLTGG